MAVVSKIKLRNISLTCSLNEKYILNINSAMPNFIHLKFETFLCGDVQDNLGYVLEVISCDL